MRWANATDNFKPSKSDIQWASEMMRVIKHGSTLTHSTGETYRIDHENKTLTLIHGQPIGFHPYNKIVFARIGYTVLP